MAGDGPLPHDGSYSRRPSGYPIVSRRGEPQQRPAPPAFGGWLRSITHRLAINRCVRRKPLLAAAPETLDAARQPGPSPLDALLAGETRERAPAGLDRLRAIDRDTLEAFYLFDRSRR